MTGYLGRFVAVLGLIASTANGATPEAGAEVYRLPAKEIVDLVDQGSEQTEARISPDKQWLLVSTRSSLLGIEDLVGTSLDLAGLSVNTRNRAPGTSGDGRLRSPGIRSFELVRISDGRRFAVEGAPKARLSHPSWSPASRYFIFLHETDAGVELWAADVESKKARALTGPDINAVAPGWIRRNADTITRTFETPVCRWMPGGDRVLCLTVPAGQREPPSPDPVPSGPAIQDTTREARSTARIDPDLLKDAYDEALFEFYAQSQPVVISLDSGQRTSVGAPAIYLDFNAAPNGAYFYASRVVRPFSRRVSFGCFPRVLEILNRSGESVRTLARLDENPGCSELARAAPRGPRNVSWLPGEPATLVYLEASGSPDPLDDGLSRDHMVLLRAPFSEAPVQIMHNSFGQLGHVASTWTRYAAGLGYLFAENGLGLVSEGNLSRHTVSTWLVDAKKPESPPTLLWEDPMEIGFTLSQTGKVPVAYSAASGQIALSTDAGAIYVWAYEYEPQQGRRVLLDRFDLRTRKADRLFRARGESYEELFAVLDPQAHSVLTAYETPTQAVRYLRRDLRSRNQRFITHARGASILAGARHARLHFQRDDGTPLGGDLFLPLGYEQGQRVPVIMWGYPMNAPKGDRVAGGLTTESINDSPYRFSGSFDPAQLHALPRALLARGYAVLYADMPVVGEPVTAFDTYLDQVVSNASAAIDYLVEAGIADQHRVGVAGHSFGGYMTANLLAHSRLFAAGCAIDGGYNATLLPLVLGSVPGVNLWNAPGVYTQLSSLFYANRVEAPLLLIHGASDRNDGTLPQQATLMYQALKGLGKNARLVMLPYEDHQPVARESVLHVLWEMNTWFDRYLGGKSLPLSSRARPRTSPGEYRSAPAPSAAHALPADVPRTSPLPPSDTRASAPPAHR